jgi:hypothetical protein
MAAFLLMALLVGCGGGSDAAAPTPGIDQDAPPLHSFNIYAVGAADGNELFADVYGITLNPLRAYRLTADKRISWLSATKDTIVVAAGDDQVDKLGVIAAPDSIGPIAGLGRPQAFSPEVQPDGTIRFQDLGKGEKLTPRYLSYDPASGKTRVLYKSDDPAIAFAGAGPGSGFTAVNQEAKPNNYVLLIGGRGDSRKVAMPGQITNPSPGKHFVAAGVFGPSVGDGPVDTALIDNRTLKVRTVKGCVPLAWTPDGTKLLVGLTHAGSDTHDTELALLDPASPSLPPEPMGTLPGVSLFMGTWVSGG